MRRAVRHAAELDRLCINTVRFLSVDAVQKANSGHPGMPLGAAPMAYVLWTRLLKHNPSNPHWFDRDRFVLSAGHGSMLLYSLLHLTGYDLSLDDLKHQATKYCSITASQSTTSVPAHRGCWLNAGRRLHLSECAAGCLESTDGTVMECRTTMANGGRSARRESDNKSLRSRSALVVFTIGHSTRPIEDFIRLLKAHRVQRVIDVRTIPRSRHNPQFNRDQLSVALHRARIHYRYMPGLGGLRRARPDSINVAWRNASFRGYADYMQTSMFRKSLDRCIVLAKRERVVLMCAEAVAWRCHRSLIADALLAKGIASSEITSGVRTRRHSLTPWAQVTGTEVTYPAPVIRDQNSRH